MRAFYYITLLLVGYVSFISCVKDNRDDCPPGVIPGETIERLLHLRTIPDKYLFEDIVESLQLFLYEEEDDMLIALTREFSAEELKETNYTIEWHNWTDLDHYNYHIIGVLNSNDDYDFPNTGRLYDFETHINPTEEDIVKHEVRDLFIGYFNPHDRVPEALHDTLYLEKLLNRIYITIEFDGFQLREGAELKTVISGNNSKYDYLNGKLTTGYMNYHPYRDNSQETDRSIFTFDIITGKLYINDDLKLSIQLYDENGESEEINSFMLVEYIAKLTDNNGNYLYNTDIKLQQEDEFYIYLIINEEYQIIDMTINDWYSVPPGPGIDL